MRIVGLPSVFYRISRYRSAALSWRARERLEKVRPLPGVRFKQFTARDVVSRWDVRCTAGAAVPSLCARQPARRRAL